jgi:DNA-directed RNA polymerase subunit M/transcription elongation factor TFIIS
MDIEFDCNKCGQHIVIDEAAAALRAQCPKCAASITVPSKPSVDVKPPSPPASVPPPEKQCPFCAETIEREERVCRFCGYNSETGQLQQSSHSENVSPPTVKAESSVESGVKLRIGMFIVLPLMIILLVAVSYQAWIGYEEDRNPQADQQRDEHEQEIANSFIGITEQELIRRLGQPKEIRREPDGSLRSLVYEDSNTNVEMFIINGEDGLVSGGEYRGHVFHR